MSKPVGNPNYRKGRAFEYKMMKRWGNEESIYKTVRAAGSHSPYDIIAYTSDLTQVQYLRPGSTREVGRDYEYKTYMTPIVGLGIQCKVRKLKGKGKVGGSGDR